MHPASTRKPQNPTNFPPAIGPRQAPILTNSLRYNPRTAGKGHVEDPEFSAAGEPGMQSRIYVIAALLALTSTGLRAQGDRGIITGTVKDASGAVMPRAHVTATHLDTNTNYTATTTASGDFTVPDLQVGNYRVRVENAGFKAHVNENVEVSPGATLRLDVAMEVGTAQQTVEVQANALVLATDTARVS